MPLPTSIKSLDSPHRVVAMVKFGENMWVATEHRIYVLVDDVLQPVPFEITGDEKPT